MAGRKHSAEQIIAILRQIEVGTADGKTTLHLVALGERGQGTRVLERDLTLKGQAAAGITSGSPTTRTLGRCESPL
jgi:hypothetical protein